MSGDLYRLAGRRGATLFSRHCFTLRQFSSRTLPPTFHDSQMLGIRVVVLVESRSQFHIPLSWRAGCLEGALINSDSCFTTKMQHLHVDVNCNLPRATLLLPGDMEAKIHGRQPSAIFARE